MDTDKQNPALQWTVIGMLGLIEAALVWKVVFGQSSPAVLIPCVTVIAGLIVVAVRIFDIESLAVGKDGVKAEIRKVREQVAENAKMIEQLFLLTMSEPMFGNLAKFASGPFGPYEMSEGLKRELYHLRDIGYVEVESISRVPASGENLSVHVHITEAGRQFVKLRKTQKEHA